MVANVGVGEKSTKNKSMNNEINWRARAKRTLAIKKSSLVILFGLVHMHLVLWSSAVKLVLQTGVIRARKKNLKVIFHSHNLMRKQKHVGILTKKWV